MKPILKIAASLLLMAIAVGLAVDLRPLWFVDQLLRFHLWRSGAASRSVEVDGHRIHYFEAAPHDGSPGQPLLLLHGLGDRAESWSNLIPTLTAHGFHVYAPDLLGYGRSAHPRNADYSIALEEKVTTGFLSALHLPRADVVGASMGGWVAMRLAADHPTLVTRLILYDSAGTYFPPTFDPNLFTPTDRPGLARLFATLSPHPRPIPAFIARDVLRTLKRNGWVVTRSMASMQTGRDLMDFRLGEIHQPTLIAWGSQDDLIPLPVGESIHRNIPQSDLAILDGCGHLAPVECSPQILAATLAFLTADPPPTGTTRHYPPTP